MQVLAVWGHETEEADMFVPYFSSKPFNFDGDIVRLRHALGVVSHRGHKPDMPNQDEFFVLVQKESVLMGVFDGHGLDGHNVAHFAQEHLPRSILERLNAGQSWEPAVRSAVGTLNSECSQDEEMAQKAQLSGTTMTVLMLDSTALGARRTAVPGTGERLPAKLRPEDAAKVVAQKARPFLDSFLKLVEVTIQTGAVVVDEAKLAAGSLGSLVDKCMHNSASLLQALCCIDLEKFTRGPEKPALQSQLPVMFVLGLLAMLYSAFVFAYMPAAGLSLNSAESILFHAFVFLTLASFAQAARTDPGDIPQSPEWRDRTRPPRCTHEQKRFSEEARWCRKSQAYKPDRAHFCRAMGRVVLRMDHHCPWLGNTVGWANHKYFYLFLTYANMACGLLGLNVLDLLVHATLPALTTFLLIGTEALTFLLSTILVPFLLFHTWLIIRNMTTIEFCASFAKTPDEKPYENPYDVGIYRNLCSVLGSSPLVWWAPVGGPAGDGISFPRRGLPEYYMLSDEEDPEAAHPAGPSEEGSDAGREAEVREGPCSFFVWVDAAEFTDDLKVGCEVILETAEDAALSAWHMLSQCRGRKRKSSRLQARSEQRVVRLHEDSENSKSEGEAFFG
ncbi:unnamed protein product [Effrenium voratum]|nr:unnamed protein product [Effrenium voratum]